MSANRFTRDSQKGPLDIMNWASSNQNQPQTAKNALKSAFFDFACLTNHKYVGVCSQQRSTYLFNSDFEKSLALKSHCKY